MKQIKKELDKNKNKGNRQPSGFAKPLSISSELCKFLDKKPLEGMPVVLARERVPKIIELKERNEKASYIKEKATNKYYQIFADMVEKYHEVKFNEQRIQ